MRRVPAHMVATAWLLAACVPIVHTADGQRLRATSDEFRDHAAAVFRRQNAASIAIADVIDALSARDPAVIDELERADAGMLKACEPLNMLAVARRDGADLSRSALLEVAESVAACDAATRHAESLLERNVGRRGRNSASRQL